MNRVYVLLLNWNGWRDTVECLESIFRLEYPSVRVIVCDNDSGDNSVERIKNWAAGMSTVAVPDSHPLHGLSSPPVTKPLAYVEYDRTTAEAGGEPDSDPPLVLIRTGGNLGFAGGNNVGLRYALARDDFEYVWLLNNDTVVRPDALSPMVERMKERPDVGICGSLMPYYDRPDLIWTAGGGTFNCWLAKSRSLDDRVPLAVASSREEIEKRMRYVAGASMLVSKAFLCDVGLMWEHYFLYFEEPDWCFRGRRRGYGLAYARDSLVFHKVGISTTLHDEGANHSAVLFFFRSQILFTARFFPVALPLVLLRVAANMVKSLFRSVRRGKLSS